MAQTSGTDDHEREIAPTPRPSKVGVACAVLLIAGTLIPLISALVFGMLAFAYGLGGGDGELGAEVASYLVVAVYGSYLAVRLYSGEGYARWAGVGLMLLVAALNVGQLADGDMDPRGFMTIVAAIGIVVLCDPAVRHWSRYGDRRALIGAAQVTGVVGLEMVFRAVLGGAGDSGGVAALQAVVGMLLVGLAIGLYQGVRGIRVLVSALVLLQPLFYAGFAGIPERAELSTAAGRLALGAYIVFALHYPMRREPRRVTDHI